jgi:hypothetical protein
VSERPDYVAFGGYSRHVPPGIPAAVQQATGRFLGLREARVAEMPRWEELRQAESELRRHTLAHLDVYLERLEREVEAAGGHVHWAEDAERARAIVLQIAERHGVRRAVLAQHRGEFDHSYIEGVVRSDPARFTGVFLVDLDGPQALDEVARRSKK